MPSHPLEPLVDLPGVAEAVAEARAACETLRWHRALRRQWPAARTEVGIRCAQAGLEVDGVRVPLDLVRDVARGAERPPAGVEGELVLGALRLQAEVERLMAAPGSTARAATVPWGQLLARLHSAVVAGGDPASTGRPRTDRQPQDLRGLGEAATGGVLSGRLAGLAELAGAPLPPTVPALVLAAVVHGELLTLRPFDRGNAAVARAVFRLQLTHGGVDPVGVVVPEVAWRTLPNVHLGAAAGFATGTPDGVAAWVRHCAQAVVVGAQEGTRVADAVLAARLSAAP